MQRSTPERILDFSQALLIHIKNLIGKLDFMGEIPEIPPEIQLAGCVTFEIPVCSRPHVLNIL